MATPRELATQLIAQNPHGTAHVLTISSLLGFIATAATWAQPLISCTCGVAGTVSACYAIAAYRENRRLKREAQLRG